MIVRKSRISRAAASIALLSLLALGAPAAAEDPPRDGAYFEQVETSLLLLDVGVDDENGEHVPGLRADDFTLIWDGVKRKADTTDEICACAGAAPAPAEPETGATPVAGAAPPGTPPAPAPLEPLRFVLYLDLSRLQPDGAHRAIKEATRWVRESLAPEREAMVVVFGDELQPLTPFTTDKEALLAALERAAGQQSRAAFFASQLGKRLADCEASLAAVGQGCPAGVPIAECSPECMLSAREEYFHDRASFEAFQLFLSTLAATPGRKAVVLFQQTGSVRPTLMYGVREMRAGSAITQLEQVSAVANAVRATVFPAYTGGISSEQRDDAIGVGTTLAEATGGVASHTVGGVRKLLDQVGRGCECVYRLGMKPRPQDGDGVHQVEVLVGDRKLPGVRRVEISSPRDRWNRAVHAALLTPDRVRELVLSAALIPLERTGDGWRVGIALGLRLGGLLAIPEPGHWTASYGAGALVRLDRVRDVRELEGFHTLSLAKDQLEALAVHRAEIETAGGDLTLAAYAGDVRGKQFGGAAAEIELPKGRDGGAAGPVLLLANREHLAVPLDEKASPGVPRGPQRAAVPLGGDCVPRGAEVVALTFVCASGGREPPGEVARSVVSGGAPPRFLAAGAVETAGDCLRVVDAFDPSALAGPGADPNGAFTYRVAWTDRGKPRTSERRAALCAPLPAAAAAPGQRVR